MRLKSCLFQAVQQLHVYLAGPDVFKPNPIEVGMRKKKAVQEAGHIAHFPMDPEIKEFGRNQATANRIAAANEDLMEKCQVIMVNLSPWHGSPSLDGGTAVEVGFMKHKAKSQQVLIIGYYENDKEPVEPDFAKRVNQIFCQGKATRDASGELRDHNGDAIEEFDGCDNLMVTSAIESTGGAIFPTFQDAVDNILPLWKKKQMVCSEQENEALEASYQPGV